MALVFGFVAWGAVHASAEESPAAMAPVAESFSLEGDAGSTESEHPWSYTGEWGPENWGSLSEEFSTCGSGRKQSPIDIADPADVDLPPLELSYHWKLAQVVHSGHAIGVHVQPGAWLDVSNKRFELLEFHFHTPSENRVAGRRFPLEAHFVHRSAEGELAVVAVFFEEGESNPSVGKIAATSPWSQGEAEAGNLRVRESELLPEDHSYYLYSGSLTTPPCTEGVRWFVLSTPQQVSLEQILAYRQIVGQNARAPQPLHSRIVLK